MFKKGGRFDIRRTSFDPSDVRKPELTGTVGNNLDFWMTAFLGFQTLGAIYGTSRPKYNCLLMIRRHWDESALRLHRVWLGSGVTALITGSFRTTLVLRRKTWSVQSAVLSGL